MEKKEILEGIAATVADIAQNLFPFPDACEERGCEGCEDCEDASREFTVSMNDKMDEWGFQTGDNSYTGGAYGFPHWGVTHIYADSTPMAIAKEVWEQIEELTAHLEA